MSKTTATKVLIVISLAILTCLIFAACDEQPQTPSQPDDDWAAGIVFEDATYVYDGEPHFLKLTGAPEDAVVQYLSPKDKLIDHYIDAGAYEIRARVKYQKTEKNFYATLTIKKAKVDVDSLKFEDATFEWDGLTHSIFVEGELPEEISVEYENNAQGTVGRHTVTAHFVCGNNFEPIPDMQARIIICERVCTVTFRYRQNWQEQVTSVKVGYGMRVQEEQIPTLESIVGYDIHWDGDVRGVIESDVEFNEIREAIEYTIIFSNDGVESKKTYTVEEEVVLPVLEKEYFDFMGWIDADAEDDEEQVYVDKIEKGSVGDRHFVAHWVALKYCVSFDLDGGLNDVHNLNDYENQLYYYDADSEELTLLAAFRYGYAFVMWQDENGEEVRRIGGEGFECRDMLLKAIWRPEVYHIYYHSGGATECVEEYTIEMEKELSYQPKPHTGRKFVGWKDENDEPIEVIPRGSTGDIDVYAEWDVAIYRIEYYDGDRLLFEDEYETLEGKTLDFVPDEKPGYRFYGWLDERNIPITKIEIGSERNFKLHANYSLIKYTLKYMNEGAILHEETFTVEDEIELDFVPDDKPGYDFAGWLDEEGAPKNKIDAGTHEDVSVHANYVPIVYKLRYFDDKEQIFEEEFTVEDEKELSYTPSEKPGYGFAGWKDGGGNLKSKIEAGTTGDVSVYAEWELKRFFLRYFDGEEQLHEETFTIEEERELDFVPEEKEGYTFDGWTRDGVVVSSIPLGTHEDVNVYAKRTAESYTLYYYDGDDMLSSEQFTIEDERELKFLPPEKNGYEFLGWRDAVGNSVKKLEHRAEDLSVYANWHAIEYKINYHDGDSILYFDHYTIEEAKTLNQKPLKRGRVFLMWTTKDGEPIYEIPVGSYGDKDVYAKWEFIKYKLRYMDDDSVLKEEDFTVEDERELSFVPPEKPGYQFSGWLDEEGKTKSKIDKDTASDVEVSASYELVKYKIRFYDDDAQIGEEEEYTIEEEHALAFSPKKDGYIFAGWLDESGSPKTKIESGSTGDINLHAKWELQTYYIEYVYDGEHDNPTEFTVNDLPITLHDGVPGEGFEFGGWFIGDERVYEITEIGNKRIQGANIKVGTGEEEQGGVTLEDGYVTGYGKGETELTIEQEINGVTVLGIRAGALRADLERLTVNADFVFTGEEFSGLANLKYLDISSCEHDLPQSLLKDCVALTELRLPFAGTKANLKMELYEVTSSSSSLFSPTPKDGCYDVGEYRVEVNSDRASFSWLLQAQKRYVPTSLTKITVKGGIIIPYAFASFTSLEEVEVSGELKDDCFNGCASLKKATVKGSIMKFAFADCKELCTLYVEGDVEEVRTCLQKTKPQNDVDVYVRADESSEYEHYTYSGGELTLAS